MYFRQTIYQNINTKRMKNITTRTSLFGAALTLAAVMFALNHANAQYMSFFGDNTWEYHVTYLTNTPEDYLNYPPESQSPTPLNVYCRTYKFKYRKESLSVSNHYYNIGFDINSFPHWACVYEKIDYGHLYADTSGVGYDSDAGVLICDMSLNEGDTFVLKDPCLYYGSFDWSSDTIGDRAMIVDSVRYIAGRKTIFLSLIDHLDDYFFGTAYSDQLSNYNFSIRFIEGIGPTYGSLPGCRSGLYEADLYPSLGLMLCMYKDDSLVYMADETLGCTQTCVGVEDYPQAVMNLYPNPATQYVVLDMSTGEEMDGSVVVTDMLGRHCFQQKAEGTSVRIPVTGLPTGMYFLTFTDGKRAVTRKFMKE